MTIIFAVWDYDGKKQRPWTTKTRDMLDALRAIRFSRNQRHRKDTWLLFSLAQWGQRRGDIPKTSLRGYLDDCELFQLLRMRGQISSHHYDFRDLDSIELRKLQKRLNHLWPDVQLMIDAMNGPRKLLKSFTEHSRKLRRQVHNPHQQVLSAMLKQLNS